MKIPAARAGSTLGIGLKHMEHRCGIRVPVALDVSVYHRGIPVAWARAHNISQDGLFVRSPHACFPKGTPLSVELMMESRGRPVLVRLSAVIMHSSGTAMGLMYDAVDPETIRIIGELMENVQRKHPFSSLGGVDVPRLPAEDDSRSPSLPQNLSRQKEEGGRNEHRLRRQSRVRARAPQHERGIAVRAEGAEDDVLP
ncbi:MAG: PilZ domain-containing protein [Gammaproteobacteria bacterium]|nr:PilZ domain-containing protein [Gammaproteobacteria bacterium]